MENKRPLSPHIQIYRWHISSLVSISHRITGIINIIGITFVCLLASLIVLGENNYEIIKEWGFFNDSDTNTLSDSTLGNIGFLFAMDNHYGDGNYYVEILDSLFLRDQKGRHLKVTGISGNKIFFDEDVRMFVASHYRLVKVKKNEYTDTIISCINYELNKEYE